MRNGEAGLESGKGNSKTEVCNGKRYDKLLIVIFLIRIAALPLVFYSFQQPYAFYLLGQTKKQNPSACKGPLGCNILASVIAFMVCIAPVMGIYNAHFVAISEQNKKCLDELQIQSFVYHILSFIIVTVHGIPMALIFHFRDERLSGISMYKDLCLWVFVNLLSHLYIEKYVKKRITENDCSSAKNSEIGDSLEDGLVSSDNLQDCNLDELLEKLKENGAILKALTFRTELSQMRAN